MRLLIAPDSFKGSCPAHRVATALQRGAEAAAAARGVALEVRVKPLSDGGEGLIDTLATALGGERRVARVRAVDVGPKPAWREATWLWVPETRTAIAEVAEVVGFQATRVRTPLERTALGVGDYLAAMRDAGAKQIIVGIGGTSTVDGGASVVHALGGRFRDARGPIHVGTLLDAAWALHLDAPEPWPDVDVVCWSDVVTPLVGPRGAVPTFAPQKGAGPAQVVELQAAMEYWGELANRETGADPTAPGTGAGGGIPFGVTLALGGRIERGAPHVLDLVGLRDDLAWAELVWTGEGRVDETTLEGKLVRRILDLAVETNATVSVLAGQIAEGVAASLDGAELHALTDLGEPVERCLREPEVLLEALAQRVLESRLAIKTDSAT